MWVFCVHECLYALCMQCWQRLATRSLRILWNLNYRQLWVAMLVLGTKPKSSSRATSTQPLIHLFGSQRRFLSTLCLDDIFLSSQWNSFIEIQKKCETIECFIFYYEWMNGRGTDGLACTCAQILENTWVSPLSFSAFSHLVDPGARLPATSPSSPSTSLHPIAL